MTGGSPPDAPSGDLVDPGPLDPLPPQPEGVSWPTTEWPLANPDPAHRPGLESLLDEAFDDDGPLARTHAVVVVHRGRLIAERYRTGRFGPQSRMRSWSMSKSILHAAVGVLVADGVLDPAAPAPVPRWQGDGDPRSAITLDHLLTMRDGLDFAEDYDPASARSDVIDMLFGSGMADVAAYAESRPAAHPPGAVFNYSSGTSNVVSAVVGRATGGRPGVEDLLEGRVLGPIGMRSCWPGFDDEGTWVASTFCDATARDFARFGLLYLRGGGWDGRRIVPAEWVDHGRRARSIDPEDGRLYGAHWWVTGDEHGTFWANGYEGQSITVSPGPDLVVVRCGQTDKAHYPDLARWRARMVEVFAGTR